MPEMKDPFDMDQMDGDGWHYITMGAENTDELGESTVRVLSKEGAVQDFDSVLVCDLAGETAVIAKEAVKSEGEVYLMPTLVMPFRDVEAIVIPMDDGRLESAEAEVVGVNGSDGC